MRKRVAILAAVIVAVIVGWSVWWYILATARDNALTLWLENRRAAGWVAEASDISVGGYPARVDSRVTGLDLADPRGGWSWRAETLDILQLAYKPQHVIAILGGEQVVATPYDTFRATSDTLRGSILFRPNPRLELDHMTFEIAGMTITGDAGWTTSIGKAVLATRQAADGERFAHDLVFDAENLVVPRLAEAADGVLPAALNTISLDSTLRFDRPWDRATIEGDNPVLEGVEIRDLSLTWGKLDLRGRGTLTVDADGFAEGRIDLRARNWEEMLTVAERSGALDPTLAGALQERPRPPRPPFRRSQRPRRAARFRGRRHPPRPDPDRPGAADRRALSRGHPPGGRQPAARAAASSQNQRSPRAGSMRVRT